MDSRSDFKCNLVFAYGPSLCVEEKALTNTLATCVNVLFIHLRNMTGLVKKNIALLLSLTYGGMSTVNIQNTLFNPNSIRLFRTYDHAGLQLLELTFVPALSAGKLPKYITVVKTGSAPHAAGTTQSNGLRKLKGICLTYHTDMLSLPSPTNSTS